MSSMQFAKALGWVLSSCLIVEGATAPDEDPSPEELVEANESAIRLIRTIDMNFEIGNVQDGSKTTHRVHWTSDVLNDTERFRYQSNVLVRLGFPAARASNTQVLRRGTEFRVLQSYPWDGTAGALSPDDQHGVIAKIDPFYGRSWEYGLMKPMFHLLWCTDLTYSDRRRVFLRDLVEMSTGAKVSGKIEVCGRQAWRLILPMLRGVATDPKIVSDFEVDIDTRTSIVLRMVEKYLSPDWPKGHPVIFEKTATEVKEFGDGILWLIQVRYICREGDETKLNSWFRATAEKINEPLAPDAFAFRFPEYSLVQHVDSADGKIRVELWGADDRPLKEIAQERDLDEFRYPRLAAVYRTRSAWLPGVSVFLLICSWCGYRRYRRNRPIAVNRKEGA